MATLQPNCRSRNKKWLLNFNLFGSLSFDEWLDRIRGTKKQKVRDNWHYQRKSSGPEMSWNEVSTFQTEILCRGGVSLVHQISQTFPYESWMYNVELDTMPEAAPHYFIKLLSGA